MKLKQLIENEIRASIFVRKMLDKHPDMSRDVLIAHLQGELGVDRETAEKLYKNALSESLAY